MVTSRGRFPWHKCPINTLYTSTTITGRREVILMEIQILHKSFLHFRQIHSFPLTRVFNQNTSTTNSRMPHDRRNSWQILDAEQYISFPWLKFQLIIHFTTTSSKRRAPNGLKINCPLTDFPSHCHSFSGCYTLKEWKRECYSEQDHQLMSEDQSSWSWSSSPST